ncbi:hypothetical protein J0A68_19280 [Algoriphagus sp. H41]|uniref:Uncharacterized protein n=1 Tax=Algoriphagus oliviformis TaxID=2811231 RepID=A0ABS3CAC5_9BACT|nr:hypothetical protein [Algoriphagus oliviformis]MBN7813106.1 hypothetical protein [Algoriphagus oliviformis]
MGETLNDVLNKSYRISLEEAAKLILAFLNERNLIDLARNEAIGGTVSEAAIRGVGLEYFGCMGWYCRDNSGRFPKLFMAFEDGSYKVGDVASEPRATTLFYPASTFTYSGRIDYDSVVDMLLSQQMPLSIPPDKEIDKDDVSFLLHNFPTDENEVPYNKFRCSFFENRGFVNRDVMDFLGYTGLKAVRYYFGYDESDSHKESNRIRIVLVGVDDEGKNIITAEAPTTNTPRILQNSWPPPPPPYQIG